MYSGKFYYIKDSFYDALPDCGLMTNKQSDVNGQHGRPCHYCLEIGSYYWMVPISSQIVKYNKIYEDKIKRRKTYDGIRFGYVNGQKRVFLIQNCFPVTLDYIEAPYTVNKGKVHVTANESLTAELNALIRKVYRLNERGIKITLTDIPKIIDFLQK